MGVNEEGDVTGVEGAKTMVDMGCNFYIKAQMYAAASFDSFCIISLSEYLSQFGPFGSLASNAFARYCHKCREN